MLHFREYYEMGTDEYAKHTKKMTPGQDVKEATYRVEIEGEGVATVQARTEKEAEAKAFRKLGLKNMRKIKTLKPKSKITKEARSKADDDAVKAFLAKGGKIKKLPPGRAQGSHGKDDPGKGMAGMLDRGDTKKFGTRKRVRSMR